MRILIADCSVEYRGRLSSTLALARRLIMIKADGCVAIHADGGAYKPLNWMNAPNTYTETPKQIVVVSGLKEELVISLEQVHSDITYQLGEDPGLQRENMESDLQRLLAERPGVLEDGLKLVRREFATAIGPVDLLCTDQGGNTVAVEIKRRGQIDGVEQLSRYLELMNRDSRLSPVRGILAAMHITNQARTLAITRGISPVEVDYEGLLEIESSQPRLF